MMATTRITRIIYIYIYRLITWATCVCEITTKSLRHLNTQILEIVPTIVQTPILFNPGPDLIKMSNSMSSYYNTFAETHYFVLDREAN